jgi:hypothetical protein
MTTSDGTHQTVSDGIDSQRGAHRTGDPRLVVVDGGVTTEVAADPAPEPSVDPARMAVDEHVLVPTSPLRDDDLTILADWVGAHVHRLAEGDR